MGRASMSTKKKQRLAQERKTNENLTRKKMNCSIAMKLKREVHF